MDFELETEKGQLLRFVSSEEELIAIEKQAKKDVREAKQAAWAAYCKDIKTDLTIATQLLEAVAQKSANGSFIRKYKHELETHVEPLLKDVLIATRKALRYIKDESFPEKASLQEFIKQTI